MNRGALLGILGFVLGFLFSATSRPSVDASGKTELEFDKHWGLYLRHEYGCPDEGETSEKTCHPAAGYRDYKEFFKAQKLAARIF